LLNKGGDLARPVSWAQRMAYRVPAFSGLERGEVVLLRVQDVRLLDERLSLTKLIRSLARREIAALAVVGAVSEEARAAADLQHLCLFGLPDDADLRDVERDVVRLIVEREAQLDRRGRQVYRQLAQLSIENQGLTAIADALLQIVYKPVVIQDEEMAVQALALPDEAPCGDWSAEEVTTLLSDRAPLHRWLIDQPLDGRAPPCTELALGQNGTTRYVAAIVIDGRLGGYLSILGPAAGSGGVRAGDGAAAGLDALDRLAAERGALVCAVELAKQRAVEAAEKKVRGDFLDLLLTASTSEERALARRAAEFGYELERYHAVLLMRVTDVSATSEPGAPGSLVAREFRARLVHTGIQVLLCPHEGALAALCSAGDVALLEALEAHVQYTRGRVSDLEPTLQVAAGIGRPGAGLEGLRRSFSQARESLALVQSLFGGDRVLSFGELTLYHLLSRLQNCDELVDFYQQTLAALVDYDQDHDMQLVDTLEAFFELHGNVSQTAERLYLHRNSLLYRIERINEITGLDLDDADSRFSLQLALKLRPFLAAACPS
jgi:purine catabolism regulator